MVAGWLTTTVGYCKPKTHIYIYIYIDGLPPTGPLQPALLFFHTMDTVIYKPNETYQILILY
jgi:hypothetical protein